MKLAIFGDYNSNFRPHTATNEAIKYSLKSIGVNVEFDWIATDSIIDLHDDIVSTYNGFWIAPGSPYKSIDGVLKIIQYGRENRIPTIGTCGGFQHMVLEYARNVLHIKAAEHAEHNPNSSDLILTPLSCNLKGQKLSIEIISEKSKTYTAYNKITIQEKYYCNFGLNPIYLKEINAFGFKMVGTDIHKEARILELDNHPFYIATLFVPQDNFTKLNSHPLIDSFLKAVVKHNVTGELSLND